MALSDRIREGFYRTHGHSLSEASRRCDCGNYDPSQINLYNGKTREELERENMGLIESISRDVSLPKS